MENMGYQEYKEPVNYVGAIFGALVAGAIAVGLWAAGVFYLNMIEYRLLALIGALVGFGAILGAGKNNWKIGIIAVLATAVAVLVGDYFQMFYVVGSNSLEINDYIRLSQSYLDENMMQYVMYLLALGLAFFVGTFGNRSGAQVAAGK